MEVEMEMDDDNDGEPPAPGTEEDAGVRPPLPPGTASTKVWGDQVSFSIIVLLLMPHVYIQNKRGQQLLTFFFPFTHTACGVVGPLGEGSET